MLTYKDVKQVGIPALLLFNLCINDVVEILTKLEYQVPNLPSRPTSLLLYVGLKRVLKQLVPIV